MQEYSGSVSISENTRGALLTGEKVRKKSINALLRAGLPFMFCAALASTAGCHFKKAPSGSADNPVRFYFTPSVDAKVIASSTSDLKADLEKLTGLHFEMDIPQSFIAVVEAFGSGRADAAVFNPFGYLLARQKYGAEARLTVLRYGRATYQGQFMVRADDSRIKEVKDLTGKKIAFVDPASLSGYLMPMQFLKSQNISIGEKVFAMKHDSVVSMVYQGQVDAGAAFYVPPEKGDIQDARMLVKTQYPDVEKKIKLLKLTEELPNEPVVFRKGLDEETKKKITDALITYVATERGKAVMYKLYGVTGLKLSTDKDYDATLKLVQDMGVDIQKQVK